MFGDKNSFYIVSVLSQYANIIFSALTIVIFLPKLIEINGMEVYGNWSKIFIPISFIGFATMGLSNAVTKSLNSDGKAKALSIYFYATLWVIFFSTIILLFLHILVNHGYFLSDLSVSDQSSYLRSSIIIVLSGGFMAVFHGYLRYLLRDYVINLAYGLQTFLVYFLPIISAPLTLSIMYGFVAIAFLIILIITAGSVIYLGVNRFYKTELKLVSINETSLTKYFGIFGIIGLQNSVNQPIFRLIVEGSISSVNYAVIDIGLKIIHLFEGLINSLSSPLFSIWDGKHSVKSDNIITKLLYLNLVILVIGVTIFSAVGKTILLNFDKNIVDYFVLFTLSIFLYNMMAVVEPVNKSIWSGSAPIKSAVLRVGILPMLVLFTLGSWWEGPEMLFAYSLPFGITSFLFIWYHSRSR